MKLKIKDEISHNNILILHNQLYKLNKRFLDTLYNNIPADEHEAKIVLKYIRKVSDEIGERILKDDGSMEVDNDSVR